MATESPRAWRPDWGVPPGEILAEALSDRDMTQAELARRTNRPLKTVNQIIKGRVAITAETALQLELVLGVPARFWLNLEREYSEWKARTRERERLESHQEWSARFPLDAMAKWGLVRRTHSRADAVEELLKFFAVSGPSAWESHWRQIESAFRRSPAFVASPEAISVWLRWGERQAALVQCEPFDEAKLTASLPALRRLTTLDPLAFLPRLVATLARCGVAFVLTPEVPGTHVSGATRWLSPTKAAIQLSLRHRTDDQFWLSVFHEIRHLLKGRRRIDHIDAPERRVFSDDEADAERFAREHLVPVGEYTRLLAGDDFSPQRVQAVARDVGIAPGIVVALLQRDKKLPLSKLNYLKRRIQWTEEAYRA